VANIEGGDAMAQASSDPKPIFPALGRHYAFTSDLAYLVVRVTVGLMIFWHGWVKVTVMSHAGLVGYFTKYGLEPAGLWAYLVPLNETLGALLITVGLFTRPAAAIMIIEFIVLILVVHVPRGYGMAVNGVEFPLMWLLMLVAVLLRGGGPWSIDRRIGKEV
jgi:putative oxidoreductase